MSNINYQFLLSLLIVALGYFCKRVHLLFEKDGETISRVVFNITLPALIINTFSSIRVETSLLLLPVISLSFGFLMMFIALFFFKKEKSRLRGMLSMILPGFNIGLFAYPLIQALFGEKGLKYIAMFDMGNALVVFGICYLLAGYFGSEEGGLDFKTAVLKLLKSVPLVTYIITLGINLSGLHFPGIVTDIAGIVSKANMPLSLMLLGIYLSFSFDRAYIKNMFKVLSLRYVTGLAAGLLLFYILPLDILFRSVLLIGLILPIGLAVVPYSVEFDYDIKFVGTAANATIIVSFALVWLISILQIHP